MNFAYTGRIRLGREDVLQVYLLAWNLQCPRLVSFCISFMQTRQVGLGEVVCLLGCLGRQVVDALTSALCGLCAL